MGRAIVALLGVVMTLLQAHIYTVNSLEFRSDTILREKYGVPFLPSKLMWSADTNHLFQGFYLHISWMNNTNRYAYELPFCQSKLAFTNKDSQATFKRLCSKAKNVIATLHGILMKLTKLQESKVNDILDAIPHSAYRWKEDRRARGLINLVSEAANYLFGIGRQKDINRLDRVQEELIARSDITSKDLAALANATDITIEDINHSLTNLRNNLTDLQARLKLL